MPGRRHPLAADVPDDGRDPPVLEREQVVEVAPDLRHLAGRAVQGGGVEAGHGREAGREHRRLQRGDRLAEHADQPGPFDGDAQVAGQRLDKGQLGPGEAVRAGVVDEQDPERPAGAAQPHGDIGADAEPLDVGLRRPPQLVGPDVHGRAAGADQLGHLRPLGQDEAHARHDLVVHADMGPADQHVAPLVEQEQAGHVRAQQAGRLPGDQVQQGVQVLDRGDGGGQVDQAAQPRRGDPGPRQVPAALGRDRLGPGAGRHLGGGLPGDDQHPGRPAARLGQAGEGHGEGTGLARLPPVEGRVLDRHRLAGLGDLGAAGRGSRPARPRGTPPPPACRPWPAPAGAPWPRRWPAPGSARGRGPRPRPAGSGRRGR